MPPELPRVVASADLDLDDLLREPPALSVPEPPPVSDWTKAGPSLPKLPADWEGRLASPPVPSAPEASPAWARGSRAESLPVRPRAALDPRPGVARDAPGAIPSPATAASPAGALIGRRAPLEPGVCCAICLSSLHDEGPTCDCSGCQSTFHQECWDEIGGCATYGCEHMPTTVKELEPAIPQAHWGQEDKTCPNCGKTILAAALRCKHCKTEYTSEAPQSRREFESARLDKVSSSRAEGLAIFVFLAGILPPTGVLCLPLAGLYVAARWRIMKGLPATAKVLYALGLLGAFMNSALLLLALLAWEG